MSENINAFIGVVSLFALSIIKLLLLLSSWREAAEKTIDAQKLRLQELQQELLETKLAYEKLGQTEGQQLALRLHLSNLLQKLQVQDRPTDRLLIKDLRPPQTLRLKHAENQLKLSVKKRTVYKRL